MKRFFSLFALFSLLCGDAAAAERKPDVLFIAIDDMRDWMGCTGSAFAKTPNLDRLARMGTTFTRAYTASALCNPSRSALLSGLRPSTTGVYSNNDDWRTLMPAGVVTLPGHLRANGYTTVGAGKVFHGGRLQKTDWDEFSKDQEREAKEADKKDWTLKAGTTEGAFSIGSNLIMPFDGPESELVDFKTASFGVAKLSESHDKPLFVACGFHRPHLPLIAPRKYFDAIPLASIPPLDFPKDDIDDLPPQGRAFAQPGEFAAIRDSGKWREHVRAYLACISFVDAQIGRLLDALEKSPRRKDTIIIVWSDHGWHHGEKEHWRKSTLWEEATRSPFFVVAPGVTKPGSVCARPVDLLGIYPTLCELTGLSLPKHLEGVSLKPLLLNPAASWERPAISTMRAGNHTARTDRWRYIRYSDGSEELYDEQADPQERTNLAIKPEHAALKAELAKWLPKSATDSKSEKRTKKLSKPEAKKPKSNQ